MIGSMKILITGSSGLIGTALTTHLGCEGHETVRLVRRPAGPGEVTWNPPAGTIDDAGLEGIEAVVHLAGAGIGDKRWSDSYRREILESRTITTDLLARTLAGLKAPPKVLLSGSAIGWYGDRGDELLDESSAGSTGFLAEVCQAWEAATQPAETAGIRVAHLRTGIVLSPAGGALRKLLPLFRLGLGGRFGSGRQWQSWISIDDHVRAIEHLLTPDIAGAVNLTAPGAVTNRDFTKVLAQVLHRPAVMTVPSFAPKLLLGGDLADALLFTGQRVQPTRLLSSGFEFRHPTLDGALRSLLKK